MSQTAKGIHLCRICGKNTEKYLEIFSEEGIRRKLSIKAKSCLQVVVFTTDVLPTIACYQCCKKLDDSWDFYQRAAKAQIILQNIFEPVDDFHNNDGLFEVLVSKEDIIVTKTEYLTDKTNSIENQNTDVDKQITTDDDGNIIINNQDFIVTKVKSLVHDDEVEVVNDVNNSNEEIHVEEHQETIINHNDMEYDETTTDHDYGTLDNTYLNNKKNIKNIRGYRKSTNRPENMRGYPWSCIICESGIFETHQDYCRHYTKEHQQAPVYKCTSCGKMYEKYRSFARHVSMHQATGQIKCDVCGKTFTMKSSLISHAAVHTDERPFQCDICEKRFKRSTSLSIHVRSHYPDDIERISCNYCDKTFRVKRSWLIHEKMHKGERDFLCDICNKSFVTKSSLIYHISSHEQEKNYECDICNQKFRTPRLLKRHAKTHLDIKPHHCDICGKDFREKSSLNSHNRIHTGVMPYSCDICGKYFRFTGILTVHKRQHTGEKPYNCTDCKKRFVNWPNYNKHMKRIHKRDTSNPEKKKRYAKSENLIKDEQGTKN